MQKKGKQLYILAIIGLRRHEMSNHIIWNRLDHIEGEMGRDTQETKKSTNFKISKNEVQVQKSKLENFGIRSNKPAKSEVALALTIKPEIKQSILEPVKDACLYPIYGRFLHQNLTSSS